MTSVELTQKAARFNNLFNMVSDYYNRKRKAGKLKEGIYFDVISDMILNPDSVILYANQILEHEDKRVESCIENGECPKCGDVIDIISEQNGLGGSEFTEILGFACTSCNWRSQ